MVGEEEEGGGGSMFLKGWSHVVYGFRGLEFWRAKGMKILTLLHWGSCFAICGRGKLEIRLVVLKRISHVSDLEEQNE